MSGTGQPVFGISDEKQHGDVLVYDLHSPFDPQAPSRAHNIGNLENGDGKRTFVSYDTSLGRNPGVTNCTSCQQQVTTNVHYKAGMYAWLMCLLFICCGLFLCCCLIPFFMKQFKDVYHTCPRCNRVLHIEKKECCK